MTCPWHSRTYSSFVNPHKMKPVNIPSRMGEQMVRFHSSKGLVLLAPSQQAGWVSLSKTRVMLSTLGTCEHAFTQENKQKRDKEQLKAEMAICWFRPSLGKHERETRGNQDLQFSRASRSRLSMMAEAVRFVKVGTDAAVQEPSATSQVFMVTMTTSSQWLSTIKHKLESLRVVLH